MGLEFIVFMIVFGIILAIPISILLGMILMAVIEIIINVIYLFRVPIAFLMIGWFFWQVAKKQLGV